MPIATSEPATIVNGTFHNPSAPAPTGPSGTPRTQAEADAIIAGWTTAKPAQPAAPATPMSFPSNGELGSTPEQLATLARWQAEDASPAGRIGALMKDPTFREKLLNGDPAAREQWERLHQEAARGAPVVPGDASPGVAEDAAAGLPATDADHAKLASSYDMPRITDAAGRYGPEQMEGDAFVRDVMAGMGFERGPGSALLADIGRIAPIYDTMRPEARETYRKTQQQHLRDIWKTDFETNRKAVIEFINRIDDEHGGRVWDLLSRSGGGATASVILAIHNRLVDMRERLAQHRAGVK
jgi:hypothetical protein